MENNIYSIEKIKEVAYGFGQHSEVCAMLRQLLKERTQLLEERKVLQAELREKNGYF